MSGRFQTSRPYDRTYSAEEVARTLCRFRSEASRQVEHREGRSCEASYLRHVGEVSARWQRVRLPVAVLESRYGALSEGDDALIDSYIARRRAGGRFPPIAVRNLTPPRLLDGHHRLRAAQIVGDEHIDAFVPAGDVA